MAANKQDKPLFIGGFRSGTTLLVNLLGMHDDLAPWFETKCLCEALRYLRVLRDPGSEAFEAQYCAPAEPAGFSAAAVLERMRIQMRATHARISGETASGKAAHERYPLGHDCLRYSLDQGLEALQTWETALRENPGQAGVCQATGALIAQLGRLHAQGFGRPHWVNKTPEISRFAAELRASLGPCRVLYMLRNGLDVVSSAGRLGWGGTEQLAYNWKGLLERTRAAMAGFEDDYLEIRYEDLLAEPAATLDAVFGFCGLEPRGARIVEDFRRGFGPRAFDATRIGASRELPASERAAFQRIAGELQAALGYPA